MANKFTGYVRKHPKKVVAYLAFVVAFVVLLLNMNAIIAAVFCGDVNWEKTDLAAWQGNSEACVTLEEQFPQHDLLDTLHLSGIAFCETQADNSGKYLMIILKGEKDTYGLRIEARSMRQYRGRFINEHPNLRGDRIGILEEIPTLALPNDDYHLYIYVWENEQNNGLADMGTIYRKGNGKIVELES